MKKLILVFTLFLTTTSYAQPDNPFLCEARENRRLNINIEFSQPDGTVLFTNPACNIMSKAVHIVAAYTHIPPEEVNAKKYCKLKGYNDVAFSNLACGVSDVVDLKDDGTFASYSTQSNTCFLNWVICTK